MSDVGILRAMDYAELRDAWPAIRPRLAALAERIGEKWMPEDVFHLRTMGHAVIWATDDLGGVLVTQIDEQPWGRSLVVWIASEVTDASVRDYMDQLHEIATLSNCSRVTFSSPRRWERMLPGLTVRYEYSFEV